jgi:hypothetical protein
MGILIKLLLIVVILSGCQPLNQGDSRKITAYGIYCTYYTCGIGYWHSERGPSEDIKTENSSTPEKVLPGVLLRDFRP